MKLFAAYAAGFFDGEGTIYAATRNAGNPRAKRPSPTILAMVANTERRPLALFQERWGGSMHRTPASERKRELHQWVLAPKNAFVFLKDIRPYLIIKADLADAAIEFYTLMLRPAKERVDYSHTVFRNGRHWVSPVIRPEFRDKLTSLHQRIRQLNMRRVPWNAQREHSGENVDQSSPRDEAPQA